MSFDLRVTFTGLTLFIPDEDAGDAGKSRLHVFHPDMTHSGHPPHFARLVVDEAFLDAKSTQRTRRLASCPLEGNDLVFDLPSAQGGPDLSLSEEILDLDEIFGAKKLTRALLDPVPDPIVSTRLSFGAGVMTNCTLGALFRVAGKEPRRLTWQVEWTVRDINADSLDWYLQPFGSSTRKQGIPLYPMGQTIHVGIYHVMRPDLPPQPLIEAVPAEGDPEHVRGFYALAPGVDAAKLGIPTREEEVNIIESLGSRELLEAEGSPPHDHEHADSPPHAHEHADSDAGSPPHEHAGIGSGSSNCVTGRARFMA